MPNTRGVLPNRTEFRWRLRKRNKHEVSICTQMMMFSFGALAFAGVAVAGPTGGEIVGGSGAITQDGLATNIDQTSQRLNIDWRTFSTAVDESINFHQPNASAVAINRITGGLPSELRGALTANGRVFVLNDAGVTFYGTSQVNVGALLATTATNLVIADDGQSFSLSGDGYGQVINRGAIDVSAGGFAVLAAPYVENAGVVRADLGQVQLVSANAYTLDLRGDGLITYTVDADTLDDIAADGDRLGVDNTGTLQARSGTVTITARTMSKVVDSVVNLAGVIDASALAAADNGGTVLVAAAGDLNLTGVVRADGGASGNGGHVKTWADGTNSFTSGALISARGGDAAGDGGFVELSGKSVHLRGTVDAGAPNGVRGRLLIDPPTTVTIGDAAQGPDIAISVLEGDASATVSAESAITILDLNAGGVTDSTWNAPGSVILRTTGVGEGGPFPGTITFNDTNDTISAAGFITIDANGTNPDVVAGNLVTTGAFADVTVTGNDLSVASVTTGGAMIAMPGDIVFGASGNIVAGDLSITADIASGNTATASLDMDAAGNIDINGNVSVTATVVEQMNAARPNARVDIAAGTDGVGTLTINGEFFTVSANATLTSNGANIHSANADASARLTAGSDIDITTSGTTLTVAATASLTGIQGSNASASADLDIIAGIGSGGGNVSLTGNTVVMADADLSTGLGTAGLVVASTGGAFSGRVVGSGFATANMFVDANAGTSAVGDVTVTGDITVDADANVTIGNITVNSITVTGSSSFSSFVAFGSDVAGAAFANADLRVDADRNAALNGDVIVTADAHEVGGNLSFMNIVARATGSGNASFIGVNGHVLGTASAFADVDINADGAVNLGNGADDVILVDADATITLGTIDVSGTASVSGVGSWSAGTASVTVFEFPVVHWASASATLDINSAGSNVTMSGDIDVLANADITVGDVHVTGKAFADGGTDGFARASFVAFESNLADWANAEAELGIHNTGGNVAINGPVTVDADATITVAAGNTITINGTASAFADNSGTALAFVAALADEAVESASADASFRISNTNGDVTLTGDVAVNANGDITFGNIAIAGHAFASASETGSRASAWFSGFGDEVIDDSADAEASFVISNTNGNEIANGDVTVNGDISVVADADVVFGTWTITGSATASAESSAFAEAGFTGVEDEVIEDEGFADADIRISNTAGDVTLNGNVLASADATLTFGDITITGGAFAFANDHATAYASFIGFSSSLADSGASASASVDIRNTDGNVTVNGDVTVAANAAQTVGNIAISGTASAQAPRDGHAFANFDGFDNDVFDEEASARASFFIGGFGFDGGTGGDVSITGDITVDAGALIAVGNLGITGAAIASASGSWGSAEASFVGINGDVADDEASATAEFDIRNTVGDVTIDGGVTVTADADETAGDITLAGSASAIALNSGRADAWFSGIEGSVFEDEASAFASFLIAGTGGNVLVTGGIAVDADATIMVGDLSVTGTAFASASGPGASASANFTGFEDAIAGDEAFASASFDIGSTEGDVTINGLISVTADADNSAGDITVAGGKTVEGVFVPGGATAIAGDGAFASAEFRGFDSDVADSAEAWASIDIFNTGGNVTLNGGVTASVDANVAVGNATIAGSAIAVVLNSGSGYGGHANADFTGVEEDLTDGAFATADVDIINTTGNLTVANGITVNADGTISIGDVSVNGLAKAFVGGSGSSYFTNAGDAHASFTGFGDELAEDEAELFASLDIASVGGNLVIDGGINVTTDTSITIGTIDITGSALAFVSGAGMGSSSQSFGGVADANFTGIDGEVVDDEPEGEGFAEITGVSGDTTINGGITVAGTGVITVGDITITGLASAATTMGSDGYGGHGFADASFTGIDDVVIEDEGFAGAELYIDVAGDLTVNGGIDVDGFAAATVGNVSITGTANAASSMMALDGIYNGYGGGVSATFTGIDDDIMESGAEAFATTDIFADGNIVLTGGVSTDAEANVAVAGVTVTGAANVSGTMLSSPYGSAHAMFTGVDGQIAASATADAFTDIFASGSGGIIITGGAATNADATVGVGDVTVTGTTGEPSGVSEYASFIGIGGDLAGSAFADAFTDIEADNGGEGFADITIIGGAMTAANATIDVGAISETLNGTAVSYIFDGGDTVTGGAFAEGFMEILAAQHEGGSGDIFIAGDTTVDATATVTGANGASAGYGPAFAIALGVVDARNDVTLVPTAGNFFVGNDIRASAVADTAGSEAVAFAAMIVEAGERQLVAAEPDGYGGQVLAQYFLDGDLSEVVTDDGNLFIKGDVLSFASANAETAGDGDGFFGEGFGGEAAAALLSLAAHGDPANGAGNFTNEFFTHEPQAIARLGGGASAFTDATQSDLDDTESNDVDGTPFTFVETDPSGLIPPVTEGEIHLPSDSFGFFGFFDVFGLFEGEFESAVAAATFVHWHGEANIFQMPMGGEGPDPYLLIKETPDIPPGTPPAPVPGGLALLPGQTVCSLGEDGTTIKSDGQFLFAEFFFEQSGLEFGKNGCEEVVSYPATADQLP